MKIDDAEAARKAESEYGPSPLRSVLDIWRDFEAVWEYMQAHQDAVNSENTVEWMRANTEALRRKGRRYTGELSARAFWQAVTVDPNAIPVADTSPACSCGNDKIGPGPYHLTTCEWWREGK